MEKINVEFKHESHKEVFPDNIKEWFINYIDNMFEEDEIKEAVLRYKCFVEIVETDSGNFKFVSHCDNQDLKEIMINSLPEILPPPNI
jgi:hypothetical protein